METSGMHEGSGEGRATGRITESSLAEREPRWRRPIAGSIRIHGARNAPASPSPPVWNIRRFALILPAMSSIARLRPLIPVA